MEYPPYAPQPAEVRAELREALRRLDPDPYLGWIAMSMIIVGGWLAWRGWSRVRW